MDSELVTGSESDTGRNSEGRSSLLSYTEYFEKLCPYYINAGMTYDEYWNGDADMVKAFRKVHDMRLEEDNFKMWLQGRYIYDALCSVAPIFRAFSKARRPGEYVKDPYSLKTEYSEYREKQRKIESDDKAKAWLEAFATRFNAEFDKRGGVKNG